MLSCSNLTTFPLFWAWERTWCTLFEYPFYLRMSHRGFLFGFVGSLSHPVATFVVRLRYFCGGSWLCFGSHGLRILFLVGVICHIL